MVLYYEGWKTSKKEALPGWGLEVFVKDVDKMRRGGVGLHPKASDKNEVPPHVRHPFLCGQPFIEKAGISYPKGGMKKFGEGKKKLKKLKE